MTNKTYRFYVKNGTNDYREIFPLYDSFDCDMEPWAEWSWDYKKVVATTFDFVDQPNGINNETKIERAFSFFYQLAQALVPNISIRIDRFNGSVYNVFMNGTINILKEGDDIFDVANGIFSTSIEVESVYNDINNTLSIDFDVFNIIHTDREICTLPAESLTYHNGFEMSKVIQSILDYNNVGLNLLPDFAPFLKNTLNIEKLVLFQKSDVKRPNASNRATNAVIQLQTILDLFLKLFRLKLIIYDNNTCQFLHESEISAMRNITDITDKILNRIEHKFGFVNIPAIELFSYEDSKSEGFQDITINYQTNGSTTNDHTITEIAADIRYIIENQQYVNSDSDNADAISDSGFALLACNESNEVITTAGIYNYPLSLQYIFNYCHRNYAVLRAFLINGVLETANTQYKVRKKTVDIEYPANFNILNFVSFLNNIAYIASAKINGDMITLELNF